MEQHSLSGRSGTIIKEISVQFRYTKWKFVLFYPCTNVTLSNKYQRIHTYIIKTPLY
jgi:hypothetical protein